VAAGCCDKGGEGDGGDGTHESQGYQAEREEFMGGRVPASLNSLWVYETSMW
jgi:hypothetical protein